MFNKIRIRLLLYILTIGIVGSILFLLLIYLLFAQIFVDISEYLISNLGDIFALSLIIIGMQIISMIISIVVSFLITERKVKVSTLIKSTILSFLVNLLFLIILSYAFIFTLFPEVFSEVEGLEYVIIFPAIIIYFSVYILPHPFYLFILSTISYYIIFVAFLNQFYEEKIDNKLNYQKKYIRM